LVLVLNPLKKLSLSRWNESIAAADRSDLQVQRRMLGVTALVKQRWFRRLAGEDRHENRCFMVVLAEVVTESALSVLNGLHENLLYYSSY
jgi:hypothetical protein